jgi:predicted small metal-binding protein
MLKQLSVVVLLIILASVFTAPAFSQEAGKMEAQKEQKMESKGEMGAMKTFSCDDKCGFMVKSHDGKEVMAAAKAHVKKHHAEMKMTDKQLKEMMKEEKSGM